MRSFALTYPQLIGQGRALGYRPADLARVRDGYDFAERMADGVYRPHGQPLITHLVRTAGIAMAEQLPTPAVVASMNHAAYEMHKFDDSRRRPESRAHRDELVLALGAEAEALVWAYHETPWYGCVGDYVDGAAALDEQTGQVLVLRLANALEDHLDDALLYTKPRGKPIEVDEDAIALARALGRYVLADEIAAVRASTVGRPHDELARPRGMTYELPSRHLWER